MPEPIHHSLDEISLIELANQGNVAALGELYSRYYQKVVSRCLTLVKNSDTALDLAQDVLIKALEKLPDFHVQASFATWLYAITTNHCLEYLRKENKHSTLPLEEARYISSDTADGDTQLLLLEKKMGSLLDCLSEEERQLLLLKYCDEKSIRQLQELHHLSASAVKMRLKRAKHKLALLFKQAADR
ncbi:RNA polymerase sigma factor [Cesiribacter andamanensis]|uniref:RNA polymerase sigma factor n=1 Tax=Cesiribacter andamanensis AMV16 TaxID=1279009 RepID=M7N0F0_9BACT|nr:RNA polymerase sigma factor [Cesiribacter andamanensis]EMR02173.1 Sigma-24 [Cesiribacter andamanensis AMV16]